MTRFKRGCLQKKGENWVFRSICCSTLRWETG